MMQATANATQELVLYGAIQVTDLDTFNARGVPVEDDGSWIALRDNPEDAVKRAAQDLPTGEDLKKLLLIYTVRFTDYGVSHYFRQDILTKKPYYGSYRFYASLPLCATSEGGDLHMVGDVLHKVI